MLSYRCALRVRSPIMCKGLEMPAQGIDAAFMRDEGGRPIIPADHLKGLCRAVCKEVFPEQLDELFGTKVSRSTVVFSDFAATLGESCPSLVRISIDDDTGAASDGHLQVIEMIAPPGQDLRFEGRVDVLGLGSTDLTNTQTLMRTLLSAIPAVGSFRGIGFGEVIAAEVEPLPASTPANVAALADCMVFDVTFDRPVLFSAERLEDNVFRSTPFAPGGAIKAALAASLGRKGELAELNEAISKITITHARPKAADGRPAGRALPQSLIYDDRLRDVLLCDKPVDGMLLGEDVARFQVDWKWSGAGAEGQRALEQLGRPIWKPAFVQRTRTAISESGAPQTDQLFVYRMIGAKDGERDLDWRFEVRRGHDVAEAAWSRLIAEIAQGLQQLGKTDARMLVGQARPAAMADCEPLWNARTHRWGWAVTLESAALLVDEEGPWDAERQYALYWRQALRGVQDVRLEAFYAEETIAGGRAAYRTGPGGVKSHRPWLVTAPGSVFLVSAPEAQRDAAAAAFRSFSQGGLPARLEADGAEPTWRTCPFVAENGYGEISFQHDVHLSRCASATSWSSEGP